MTEIERTPTNTAPHLSEERMPEPGVILGMPARLVMVRHGESEANVIQRAIKARIISEYPDRYKSIPDREFRLSRQGCQQARDTGPWLREQYPEGFDVICVSDHVRARETVALVCQSAGWNDVEIRIDPLLGERNWGTFSFADSEKRDHVLHHQRRDPLHGMMPDGETLLGTRHRSRELLDRCARQYSGKRILVVSHGEYIESLWSEIAHFSTEQQLEFFRPRVEESKNRAGDIKNCQVVEFSSVDPSSHNATGKLHWVRSSCPRAQFFGEWATIARARYSPQDLLRQVNQYPNLDLDQSFFSIRDGI